ncbi:MAG: hypothetical protein EOM21_13630 [Gammaproteobacteria bacterium]|nr:hypothetical protein [Gammaproteobacteria bacterium]
MSDARWVRLSRQASLLVVPKGLRFEAECARLSHFEGLVWDETDEAISDTLQEIVARAASTHLLMDWRGISLRGVQNLPYTPERGLDAMLSAPKFLSHVLSAAEGLAKISETLIERTVDALEWQLRWGKGLDALRLSYKRTGEVPKALRDQPDMTRDVKFYLDCFRSLTRFRGGSGFGLNPLTYADVSTFASELGYAPGSEPFLFFLDVISALDSAYLTHSQEKSKTQPKKSASAPKRR